LPHDVHTIFAALGSAATGAGAARELPHILQKFIPTALIVPHEAHLGALAFAFGAGAEATGAEATGAEAVGAGFGAASSIR
jgi:hypothetical protein